MFKKGDKIRRIKTDVGSMYPNFIAGYESVVDRVYENTVWDVDGKAHSAENIALIDNASPVRTVTRREIVPGWYGAVRVHEGGKKGVWCELVYTADDLRSAARIFNEIADALDENSKEAA